MSEEYTESAAELDAQKWGARLTEARESQSLTCEQVASELNLPAEYIEILEQGGLEGLPSIVFAKGYIRGYAKLLHLEAEALLAEYEQLHGVVSSKGYIKPVGKEHQQVKMSHPVMKLTNWLIVLAIVGASVWWWQTQYGGEGELPAFYDEPQNQTANKPNPAPVVQMEDGSAKLVLPKLEDEPESSVPEEEEQAEQDSEIEAVEPEAEPEYLSEAEIKKLQQDLENNGSVEDVASEENSVAIEVPAQTPELNIAAINAEFISECWVSIKDADGKTLFNNLRGKGQSVSVSGKPPLNVLIGAADAVGRFSFNGEELDLAQHSRKNIVRINLPLDE